ncbi:MAG: hypothetical protein EXR71_21055 [Myxococcales bacterium]|nr:hypothetical protein [Myxococcales bacterium]
MKCNLSTLVVATAVLAGCSHSCKSAAPTAVTPEASPSATSAAVDLSIVAVSPVMSHRGITVRMEAMSGSGPSIGLTFLVTSTQPQTFSVWVPTIPRDMRAFIDGRQVQIAQPALDTPAMKRQIHTKPGEVVRIPSPVLLTFGDDGARGNGFTWTIRHMPPPKLVEIEAALEIDEVVVGAPRVSVKLGG